jgi:hypothetical protein
MLRASTRSFGVILDNGEEIRGVLTEADISEIANLMDHRVMILGKAIYRPSGRLLRVDAESVEQTNDTGSFFSAVPRPIRRTLDVRDIVHDQSQKMGVAAIIGKWPGDETDEQILEALKSLS